MSDDTGIHKLEDGSILIARDDVSDLHPGVYSIGGDFLKTGHEFKIRHRPPFYVEEESGFPVWVRKAIIKILEYGAIIILLKAIDYAL